MRRALVVDDDRDGVDWLAEVLHRDGFDVVGVDTGSEALAQLGRNAFELAIVNLELPDQSGRDVVRAVREAERAASIVALSTQTSDEDVVNGLSDGADHLMAKPVNRDMLLARIAAVLRRFTPPPCAQVADVTLDRTKRTISGPKGHTALTGKEFDLLAALFDRHGQMVPRATLLSSLWGYTFDPGTSVLDVALTRVRRKLAAVSNSLAIRSVRNLGVTLDQPSSLA